MASERLRVRIEDLLVEAGTLTLVFVPIDATFAPEFSALGAGRMLLIGASILAVGLGLEYRRLRDEHA